jgi:bisphosphoglycerate-dependent phosphoglycerate mutase
MIEKLIEDLKNLKDKDIKSFKIPMVGNTNYDIDEMLNLLKRIND